VGVGVAAFIVACKQLVATAAFAGCYCYPTRCYWLILILAVDWLSWRLLAVGGNVHTTLLVVGPQIALRIVFVVYYRQAKFPTKMLLY
jgi:hypothetical protein